MRKEAYLAADPIFFVQVSRQDEEERDVKTGTEGMASLVNIPRPSLEASDAAIHSKAAHSTVILILRFFMTLIYFQPKQVTISQLVI